MEEGGGDPSVPNDGTDQSGDQAGWTVVLYTPPRVKLERRKTPRGVNSYKAAGLEAVAIASLPDNRAEPNVQALGWSEETLEKFDSLCMDYRDVQRTYWLGSRQSGFHQLGGYARFEQ